MTIILFGTAWLIMLFWAFIVYPQRYNKGYIARFQRRATKAVAGPPIATWKWLLTDLIAFIVIMLSLAMLLYFSLQLLVRFKYDGGFIFIAYMIRIVDDVLNGEDDIWKKRYKTLKNKVKWLWTPAMEPAKIKT